MLKYRVVFVFVYAVFALLSVIYPMAAFSSTSASPTLVKLVEVASINKGALSISWLPTTDDNTPHAQLLYRVYVSEAPDFLPGPKTLKMTAFAADSAEITGLKPGKSYSVLVTATDQDGNVSWSNLLEGHTVAVNAKRTPTAVHDMSAIQNQATAKSRAALKPIVAGDLLVNAEQGGYLRQVTGTSKAANGEVVTKTASTSLNRVFSDLSFMTTLKLQDVPAPPALATTRSALSLSTPQPATAVWGRTRLTLASDEPPPAVPATPKSKASAQTVNGQNQKLSNSYITITAPAYVGAQPNQAAQWQAGITARTLASVPTEVCKAELVSFTHPDSKKNTLAKPVATFTRTADGNGEYRSGTLRMDWLPTVSHVDLEGRPYLAKIKAYIDAKADGCNGDNWLGVWKSTLEMEIPVYVTQGTPDAAATRTLRFDGNFDVTDRISYDIKPELVIGATLSGGGLRTAVLKAKADLSFTNNLTITATGAATLDQRIPLLKEKRFVKIFLASGIPIVVSGKFKIDAHLEGAAHGNMVLKKTLDLKLPNTEFGLQYSRGAWSVVGKKNPTFQLKIAGEADANAELTLTLIPDFQISFYDAASGRLLVEPYLYAQTDLQGQFRYAGIPSADWDYWFNTLEAGAGANLRLYAGLSIFDYTIASYPADTSIDDIDQFAFSKLLPKTPLAKLPTLTATLNESPNIAAPTDSRTLLVQGQATDYVDPLKLSLVKFTAWTAPSVLPAETAKLKSTGQAGAYWFTYTAPGTYTVRLAGYSNLGKQVRQIAEQVIDLTDNDQDGMVDQWESRYGVNDPSADDDDDGANNWAEFQAGTYPNTSDRFVKMANNGKALPDTAVLGSGSSQWACTKDQKTGLVWEMKTDDGGLRDKDWRYTWYDPQYLPDTYDANGYVIGFGSDGIWAGWENPEKLPYNYGRTNQQLCNANPAHCNTYAYTRAVNAKSLCAARDWRMPSREELLSISPALYPYYPQGQNYHYWSSSPFAGNSNDAWLVVFDNGDGDWGGRNYNAYVRLVRGGQ